ncbi:MAG: isopentenyl-diphosphate delta-isomerase [Firmicutes bacterium]|nr:isopentenyl-diphosphate delta-isomerase [Bacillota bacterium]
MSENNKEILLVDLNDNPIGKMKKLDGHKKPFLHRAFSIYLINGNKVLIQKRSIKKYHSGGLWANACCSHPISEDIISEANKRLEEELGITAKIKLKNLFDFVYYAQLGTVFEYEFDYVLLGKYDGHINLNTEEVEDFEWIEISKLEKELIEKPEKFAPWFLISAPNVIKKIKNILK